MHGGRCGSPTAHMSHALSVLRIHTHKKHTHPQVTFPHDGGVSLSSSSFIFRLTRHYSLHSFNRGGPPHATSSSEMRKGTHPLQKKQMREDPHTLAPDDVDDSKSVKASSFSVLPPSDVSWRRRRRRRRRRRDVTTSERKWEERGERVAPNSSNV